MRFWWTLPLAVGACGSSASAPSQCTDAQALVAASDYSSSAVGALSADGREALRAAADLGGDPALAVSRGRAFFVARDQDAVFEIDPRCGAPKAKYSTHDPAHKGSSNPQDVAVAPDGALWVPRYNVPSIAVLDASGAIVRAIDLSPFDEVDANPNASGIVIADVGGAAKAFVTLERLDDANGLRSTRPSAMLRVDVATAQVEAMITLLGRNPFGSYEYDGAIHLAEPGNFDALDEANAGIERFDIATSTSRMLVGERDLGGSVARVAVTSGCGAAIVADASTANKTALVTFDPDAGRVLAPASAPVMATDGFDLSTLVWLTAGGETLLLVGDRRATSGGYAVHVFERTGACALRERSAPVILSQKPVALRVVP